MTIGLNLPPGYPTNPDGSAKLSPVAVAKALTVPCTTGGTIQVTRDIYWQPSTGPENGIITDCLLELTPLGWAAFGNDPTQCQLAQYGCESSIGLSGLQEITYPPSAPYGAGTSYDGMTYANLRSQAGKGMVDCFDGIVNAKIAARCVGGAMTPCPNPFAESTDAVSAQQANAWDLYYSSFTQPNPAAPPIWTPGPQET